MGPFLSFSKHFFTLRVLCILICCFNQCVTQSNEKDDKPCVCMPKSKSFNENITGNATACPVCYFFYYNFTKNQDWAVNLCINSTSATTSTPLFIVVRESLNVMSFHLPVIFPHVSPYLDVCRILCPLSNYPNSDLQPGIQNISVEISTSGDRPIDFTFVLGEINEFIITKDQAKSVIITPTRPAVFQYDLEKDMSSARIEAKSNDESCMVLSLQKIQCPIYSSTEFGFPGYYQTLTQQSGISITQKTFPQGKQYIVLILLPTDIECLEYLPTTHAGLNNRQKEVTIEVYPAITDQEFYTAIFGALAFYVLLFLFSFLICCIFFVRKKRSSEDVENVHIENPSIQLYGSTSDSESNSERASMNALASLPRHSPISVDEVDMDKLPDAEVDKNIVRTKTTLYVSDLSKKKDKYLSDRAKVYSWNLLTVAIFYGLPVVQLVYINQRIVIMTGNQDICYYNFLCSHKVRVFSDFNHVYSNIGYVMLGVLFLLLVWRREAMDSSDESSRRRIPQAQLTGIPRHYGLFFAMGWALVMQGVLSASYHVCPNQANFQFDTAFMYVIATVCMLKLYQSRHPDISAKSHTTWMVLAVVIIICFAGVIQGGIYIWIIFVFGHVAVTLLVSAKIYYVGRCKVDCGLLKRIHQHIKLDIASRSFRPTYMGRFFVLSAAALVNFGLDIYGFIKQPRNFGSFLLSVFIANLLLYLIYYSLMKIRYKERIGWIPLMYMVLSFVFWIAALNFFLAKNTSWQVSPAMSREGNKHCIILNFYDHHDVWHFLSSCALFFAFMVLLTLDDDLELTPRTEIVVF